jgi:hypothetical protein
VDLESSQGQAKGPVLKSPVQEVTDVSEAQRQASCSDGHASVSSLDGGMEHAASVSQ